MVVIISSIFRGTYNWNVTSVHNTNYIRQPSTFFKCRLEFFQLCCCRPFYVNFVENFQYSITELNNNALYGRGSYTKKRSPSVLSLSPPASLNKDIQTFDSTGIASLNLVSCLALIVHMVSCLALIVHINREKIVWIL